MKRERKKTFYAIRPFDLELDKAKKNPWVKGRERLIETGSST